MASKIVGDDTAALRQLTLLLAFKHSARKQPSVYQHHGGSLGVTPFAEGDLCAVYADSAAGSQHWMRTLDTTATFTGWPQQSSTSRAARVRDCAPLIIHGRRTARHSGL